MLLEFHQHTEVSKCSGLKYDILIKECEKKNIDIVNITDHNTIKGALELKSIAPFRVIVSEEIKTDSGEIIGMFLKEEIESGLSVSETIKKIKSQGGLVAVPHAFDRIRKSTIKFEALKKNIKDIDIIEIFNSRVIFNYYNNLAKSFCEANNKIPVIGSDAHFAGEVGKSTVKIENFETPEEFLEKLKTAEFIFGKSSIAVHFKTFFIKNTHRFKRLFNWFFKN